MTGPLPEPFILGITQIEQAHSMVKGDLLRVSQIESGVGANPHPNQNTGAAGPIQMMPSVQRALGWQGSPEEFNALPLPSHIPFMRRYFARFSRLPTLTDAYAAVFWPAAVGQSDDFLITGDSHSAVYRYNAVLDVNGDGKIERKELDPAARRWLRGPRWRAIEVQCGLTPEPETSVVGTTFWLQSSLAALGFYHGEVDGLEGPKTRDAVIEFQKRNNLAPDGIVGPATVGKLRGFLGC